MADSRVIQPADQGNRENGSGIHPSANIPPRDGASEEQLEWKPSCHAVFKPWITWLLAAVAMKYAAKSEDPFITHPLQTWSFLSAIFIYFLLWWVLKQLKNHQNQYLEIFLEILGAATLASGVHATFSLLSLLLPDFPGRVLLYASWASTAPVTAWPLRQCTCNWLLKGVNTLLEILSSLWKKFVHTMNFCQQESSAENVPRASV